MSNYQNIFGSIAAAKDMTSYAQRLPGGHHQVVLAKFGTKDSQQSLGTFLEGEFMINQSTAAELRATDVRGWPWFIQGQGWTGSYAQANAKQFIEAVMRSIDLNELPKNAQGLVVHPMTGASMNATEHNVNTIGELLADGFFRGIQIAVEVVAAFDKKTNAPRTDKGGKPVYNATWKAVPGQTLAAIAEVRAYLDTISPPVAPRAASPAPAPAPAAAYVAPVVAAPVPAGPPPGYVAAAPAYVAPVAAAPVAPAPGGFLAGLRK